MALVELGEARRTDGEPTERERKPCVGRTDMGTEREIIIIRSYPLAWEWLPEKRARTLIHFERAAVYP